MRRSDSLIPPVLPHSVLPVDDVTASYETCAVVGRGASLLGSKLGSAIDRHNAVFRFDNSPTAFKYASDVGRRTRYQVGTRAVGRTGGNGNGKGRWRGCGIE